MEPVCALTWNSCPADILYLIFKLLSPLEHQALCLVSQKFRTIAEPPLYSKIQFTWQKKHAYYSDLERPPPIAQLLRTFISKPQLAAHIRRLHLDGKAWAVYATRFKLPKIHIPEDQLAEPVAFIRRTGVPYRDWWSTELRDGSIDALVALLLAQLSCLNYLRLGRAFTRQSALTGMMLRSAICESGTFKLGNFQHLQELSFLRQNPDTWTWPAPHAPVPSKLKTLNLTNIREGCLGEILAVTKNLETLHWKWYYDSGVAAALSHVQGTLTDLTITADCQPAAAVGDQFFPGLEATGSLRALVNFGRIKTLRIPLAFLRSGLLWEWKDYAILGQLESWLREWTRWTLRLSRITLLLSWIDTDTNQWPPRAREQLHGLSVQAGIRLDFVNTKHQL
ncbi:hypothetical protein BDW71DRAFT_216649 [Aspergillus fruticulosus]